MATLGRRSGIAVVGKLRVRGLPGWLIARGYHVLQLLFAARRARVVADWTLGALFRRDVAELSVTAPSGVSAGGERTRAADAADALASGETGAR